MSMSGYDELLDSARRVRPEPNHQELMAAVDVAIQIRRAVIEGKISESEEVGLRRQLNTTLGEHVFIPGAFCRGAYLNRK